MDGFRVRISLKRYFTDERRKALIWVDPSSSNTILQLEQKVRELFRLRGAFCFLKDDLLLPSTENIRLLSPDDIITVTPLSNNFEFALRKDDIVDVDENIENIAEKEVKKKKRKKQKEVSDDSAIEDINLKNDKKKNVDNSSVTSTPERSVPKKCSIATDSPKVMTVIENIKKLHAELSRPHEDEEMKSKTLTALKDITSPNVNTLPSLISDGRITKRKRVRIRKSKKNNQSIVSALSDGESGTPHINNSVMMRNGSINSHIRFQAADSSPVPVLRNKSHSIDEKPRIIKAIKTSNVEVEHSTPQSPVIDQENFLCEDNISNGHLSLDVILKDIDKFPAANVFPQENDVIIFKMLKMNEEYTPVLSNYILGRISNACLETSFVKIYVLDGHSECVAPAGKFDIEEHVNGNPRDELDLSWNQVINPKLINV